MNYDSNEYLIYLLENDECVQAFLDAFGKLPGCSWHWSKSADYVNGMRLCSLSINLKKSKRTRKKDIQAIDERMEQPVSVVKVKTVEKIVVKGGRPRTADPTRYTVGEVYEYCQDHKQTEAAEHFGIPYRSLQRYIKQAKDRGGWHKDSSAKFGVID